MPLPATSRRSRPNHLRRNHATGNFAGMEGGSKFLGTRHVINGAG